jgi:predicted CopG family antitoxin
MPGYAPSVCAPRPPAPPGSLRTPNVRSASYPGLKAGDSLRSSLKITGVVFRVNSNMHTHTYTEHMATKTISITDEAYDLLKGLKKSEKDSFSDVIVRHYPRKKKLSEVLKEIGDCGDLANSIELASKEMRSSRMREVDF